MASKKQVPAFFKALLYSDGQKAFPKSGELVLTSPGMTGYQADGGNSEPAFSLFKAMENRLSQIYEEWA